LIYPLEQLRTKGFEVVAFFYNPNIHPQEEYSHRRQECEKLAERMGVEILAPEYIPSQYYEAVAGKEKNTERCSLCWAMRLKATAKKAKDLKFTHFSTTLLVSPYQDQGLLEKIGRAAGGVEGVEFLYEDFRPGFRKAHEQAKAQGIYCQKYCGCSYSLEERCRKSAKA
jgi:predicted adenine nucleotide alpha hydrolase (AANH) superfamily ATPase